MLYSLKVSGVHYKKDDINTILRDQRKLCEATRWRVIFDGWIVGKGRTLFNFLVHCLGGAMFIKFVNA